MLSICLTVLDEPSDQARFTEIYYSYNRKMFAVAKAILHDEGLAEDAVQEAFLSVAQNFMTVPVEDRQKLRAYLILCVKWRALNARNAEQVHKADSLDYTDEEPIDNKASTEDAVIRFEQVQMLLTEVKALEDTYRIPLYFKIHGFKAAEIGAALDISAEAAQKRIERGRQILLERMRQDGKE